MRRRAPQCAAQNVRRRAAAAALKIRARGECGLRHPLRRSIRQASTIRDHRGGQELTAIRKQTRKRRLNRVAPEYIHVYPPSMVNR